MDPFPWEDFGRLVGGGALTLFVGMCVAWLISWRTRNAGIVDLFWAGLFIVLGKVYAILAPGMGLRVTLITSMLIIASIRLCWHLVKRYKKEVEDPRYAELRQQYGDKADAGFFWIFQFQGVLMLAASLPIAVACLGNTPHIQSLEWLGLAVWAIGVAGESIADAQLGAFKAQDTNHDQVCDKGLWYYSRHPNYFFEWVIWLGYYLFACASPWGWATFLSPLVMLFFLTKITGIAMTEAQTLKSSKRGPKYKLYQETTSPFIPWFKRRSSAGA